MVYRVLPALREASHPETLDRNVLLPKQENNTSPGLRGEKIKKKKYNLKLYPWIFLTRSEIQGVFCFLGYMLQDFCQEVSHSERTQKLQG